jgi:hypothetical protein
MHPYSDFLFCKNNFFVDPDTVLTLANSLEYNVTSESFPGVRTENIATSNNPACLKFANSFIESLVSQIYKDIVSMTIDIRFHRYPLYSQTANDPFNQGWAHTDHELLAGVCYLNKGVVNFSAGTSFYIPKIPNIPDISNIRKDFNKNLPVDQNMYANAVTSHNSLFEKTLTIGNMYNRLVTYDSKIFHKPDNFYIGNSEVRTTLLFVISEYVCRNNNE